MPQGDRDATDTLVLFQKLEHVRMSNPVKTVRLLYDEFYGIGEFEGKPIFGGFAALERDYKNRWRKGWNGAESKFFSRCTQLVNYIASEGEGKREEAIEKLGYIYSMVDFKLSKLIDVMKQQGLIVAASRRGRGSGR